MTYLDSATQTFSIQINALQTLSKALDVTFTQACNLLLTCKGKVVVCGMGKSGHVGNKIAATLASTGTPAFFMHPGEANHGDFGMLSKDDVLIGISNSGETSELVSLLPSIVRPIIIGATPIFLANAEAPYTNLSALQLNTTKPTTKITKLISTYLSSR